MSDSQSPGGKRWQPTISFGNLLAIASMVGSAAFIYGTIMSRLSVVEVKVDNLAEWVHTIAKHQPGNPGTQP